MTMRLDIQSRIARKREARIRRKVEAVPESDYKLNNHYQPGTGSLVDCKGDCGKVTFPFMRDGYCSDCYQSVQPY